MPKVWDVAVIGAGPAGLSAAAEAAREGLSCVCIDRMGPGGLLINHGALHDAASLGADITGPDLVARLLDAAVEAGVELSIGEVRALRRDSNWIIETDDDAQRARAVVIATGLSAGTLDVAGEAAFEGRGLSHCAACDGPLYVGQPVAVVGGDEWAVQEALDLAAVAAWVTWVDDGAAESRPVSATALQSLSNVEVMAGRVVALTGEDGLEALTVARADGQATVPARAVFVYSRRIPAVSLAQGLLDLDGSGHIMVDTGLRAGATLAFAAGDVRADGRQRVVAAIADGERAGRAAAGAVKALAA
ncbi:MAG TPA: NAD(P)/FAD-dependent oxidoreductase [Vineibacter sp.]|nr:NAD(P)/FAD-dependent oxidoreductase [Vineibacter sp.]